MRPQDVAKAWDPERFHPFVLEVSNGDTYEIRHPEQVVVGRSTVAIGTQRRNGQRVFERLDTVARLHVFGLAPIEDTEVA
jgi:hypothetical protein